MASSDPDKKDAKVSNSGYVGKAYNKPFASERSFDMDYILKKRILKTEGYKFNIDKNGHAVASLQTDDLKDLPLTLMDIYSLGRVIPLGEVLYPNRKRITKETIMEAHRNLRTLCALPTARVLYMFAVTILSL